MHLINLNGDDVTLSSVSEEDHPRPEELRLFGDQTEAEASDPDKVLSECMYGDIKPDTR